MIPHSYPEDIEEVGFLIPSLSVGGLNTCHPHEKWIRRDIPCPSRHVTSTDFRSKSLKMETSRLCEPLKLQLLPSPRLLLLLKIKK